MKLKRPYVPIKVRLVVAERQLAQAGIAEAFFTAASADLTKRERLTVLLWFLFRDEPYHLDHDPPLNLREHDKWGYIPDANDPDYLIYRTKQEHRIKTYVHGDGAQLSDAGKRRKEIKRKRKRPSRPWPKRPLRSISRWPQGRKLRHGP
jgi:hypothetical protein